MKKCCGSWAIRNSLVVAVLGTEPRSGELRVATPGGGASAGVADAAVEAVSALRARVARAEAGDVGALLGAVRELALVVAAEVEALVAHLAADAAPVLLAARPPRSRAAPNAALAPRADREALEALPLPAELAPVRRAEPRARLPALAAAGMCADVLLAERRILYRPRPADPAPVLGAELASLGLRVAAPVRLAGAPHARFLAVLPPIDAIDAGMVDAVFGARLRLLDAELACVLTAESVRIGRISTSLARMFDT